LEWNEKGCIVLCRTSNKGGSDLQSLDVNGRPLYQHVADLVANKWNTNGQCNLVVGATFPDELKKVRDIVGDMPLLVPGIGAQGGDIKATLMAGKTASGGMIINSSRAILFAETKDNEDFAEAARRVAMQTMGEINMYR
jgi:orotidine-5'-phosphate decarboxylase